MRECPGLRLGLNGGDSAENLEKGPSDDVVVVVMVLVRLFFVRSRHCTALTVQLTRTKWCRL